MYTVCDFIPIAFSYVREWLDSMVCLRAFNYEASTKTYIFPESRHAMFIKTEERKRITQFCEVLPMLASHFTSLLDCFKHDGPRGKNQSNYHEDLSII